MGILTFVNVFSPGVKGGGPAQSLAHLLHAAKLKIRVFTSARDLDGTTLDVLNDQWVKWPENSNVKVFYSSKKGFRQLLQIYQEIKSTNPKVLWINSFFDFKYSIIPQLAARLDARSVVISPRGELMEGAVSRKKLKKIIFIYLQKMLYPLFVPRFHFTSEEEFSDASRYLGQCNGFLFPNYSRIPSTQSFVVSCANSRGKIKKLLFLARLVPKKGLDIALRVLAKLDQAYTLEVYGEFEDPHYGAQIKELISTLKLFDRVNFRGFIRFQEAIPQISRCQLMLSPTRGENFGHSIYECLSIGLPVVISDQSPWKDSLGIRVCRLNDIEAYVKEIIAMDSYDPILLAKNAWKQSQIYYDSLPASSVFLNSLITGEGFFPLSLNLNRRDQ